MIIRRRHTANFTTIGNVLFEDERLQADELGILAFLLSRPHDWEVRRPALMRRWGIGREAVKRVISNLVRYGWCRACRTRLADGTFYTIYEIRDEPGPTLSDDEVRRALSPLSGEITSEMPGSTPPTGCPLPANPLPADPSSADPPPDNPYADNIILQKIELQKTESQKKNSIQKIEREAAREKEKHATNLGEFKRRYPTAASDDQGKIDRAWFSLSLELGQAALAGISPFLSRLKRDKRTTIPAGWKYLEEQRWLLLEHQQPTDDAKALPGDSVAAKAVIAVYKLAGKEEFLRKVMQSRNGEVYYRGVVTPQLLALAQSASPSDWITVDRRQAGAWNEIIDAFVTVETRVRLKEGSRAPWPWPPRHDGALCTSYPTKSSTTIG
jgi:hypothetical protein